MHFNIKLILSKSKEIFPWNSKIFRKRFWHRKKKRIQTKKLQTTHFQLHAISTELYCIQMMSLPEDNCIFCSDLLSLAVMLCLFSLSQLSLIPGWRVNYMFLLFLIVLQSIVLWIVASCGFCINHSLLQIEVSQIGVERWINLWPKWKVIRNKLALCPLNRIIAVGFALGSIICLLLDYFSW